MNKKEQQFYVGDIWSGKLHKGATARIIGIDADIIYYEYIHGINDMKPIGTIQNGSVDKSGFISYFSQETAAAKINMLKRCIDKIKNAQER